MSPSADRVSDRALLGLLTVCLTALILVSTAVASPPLRQLTAHRDDLPGFDRAAVRVKSIPLGHGFARMLIRHPRLRPLGATDRGFLEGVEDSLYTPAARVFSAAVMFRSAQAARERMALWALEAEFILPMASPNGPVPTIPGSWTMAVPGHFSAGLPPRRFVFFEVSHCIAVYSLQYTDLEDFEGILHIVSTTDTAATALYHRAQAVCGSLTSA